MHSVGLVLYYLGWVYVVILVVRALFSWFPESSESPLNPVRHAAFALTEPVLAPFRRLIPPIGGLDLSFLIVVLVLELVMNYIFLRL